MKRKLQTAGITLVLVLLNWTVNGCDGTTARRVTGAIAGEIPFVGSWVAELVTGQTKPALDIKAVADGLLLQVKQYLEDGAQRVANHVDIHPDSLYMEFGRQDSGPIQAVLKQKRNKGQLIVTDGNETDTILVAKEGG